MRDALLAAVGAYANAIPALASQGQDPSKIINSIAIAIKGRMDGQPIEDVIAQAFTPEVSPEVAAAGEVQGAPGQVPSGEPTGAPQGGAPMPAQGGGSALQNLLAGLSSSGRPALSASVSRRSPA